MLHRFTKRARQVVVLAREETCILGHDSIGTGHILLGLLREKEGSAARVLERLGVTYPAVRAGVASTAAPREEVTGGRIPFTPGATEVLERAFAEALSLGHNCIAAEHILLALVRGNEGVAHRILLDMDAETEKVRDEVILVVSGAADRESRSVAEAATAPRPHRSDEQRRQALERAELIRAYRLRVRRGSDQET